MRDEKLTGRIRYRYWKHKLVLQVERKYWMTTNIGGSIDTDEYVDFRDARIEDLTTETSANIVIPGRK